MQQDPVSGSMNNKSINVDLSKEKPLVLRIEGWFEIYDITRKIT